mmetsp:Transcript_17177/g.20821  ORF Transcript_17177/g.20821 Transcript_17177/m.20821 type:complete len:84 (-) Transcript_17177:683-934(-)
MFKVAYRVEIFATSHSLVCRTLKCLSITIINIVLTEFGVRILHGNLLCKREYASYLQKAFERGRSVAICWVGFLEGGLKESKG